MGIKIPGNEAVELPKALAQRAGPADRAASEIGDST
jgi:hypothetical protein